MRTLIPAAAVLGLAVSPLAQDEIDRQLLLLTSPIASQREVGAAWLREHGDRALEERLALLRDATLAADRRRAIEQIGWLVSPWFANRRSLGRNHGHVNLGLLRRPFDSAAGHPRAGAVRDAVVDAIKALFARPRVAPRPELDPDHPGVDDLLELPALLELHAEVAGHGEAEVVAAWLTETTNTHYSRALSNALARLHVVPDFFTPRRRCGNGNLDTLRAFGAEMAGQAATARTLALAWHRRHATADLATRLRAAAPEWERHYRENGVLSDFRVLERLMRPGQATLDAIADWRGSSEPRITLAYELLRAAILGQIDPVSVRRRLGGDDEQRQHGLGLIRLAGSREFFTELSGLAHGGYPVGTEAADVLVSIHREDARKVLREVAAKFPDNHVAPGALLELDAWGL